MQDLGKRYRFLSLVPAGKPPCVHVSYVRTVRGRQDPQAQVFVFSLFVGCDVREYAGPTSGFEWMDSGR